MQEATVKGLIVAFEICPAEPEVGIPRDYADIFGVEFETDEDGNLTEEAELFLIKHDLAMFDDDGNVSGAPEDCAEIALSIVSDDEDLCRELLELA